MARLLAIYFAFLSLPIQIQSIIREDGMTLTITNNCSFTVWPAVRTVLAGSEELGDYSGFALQEGESKVLGIPPSWGGRIWGRTLCSVNSSTGNFSCQSGDCGTGKVECDGGTSSSSTPTTLAEFTFDRYSRDDYYDVSVAEGYNLPLMVAPQVANGDKCQATGCVIDLDSACTKELKVFGEGSTAGSLIGCKNPCQVYRTEQYCCPPQVPKCNKNSNQSLAALIFNKPCPRAWIFETIRDDSITFSCDGSWISSYNITFCPSPTMSRLFSVPAQSTQRSAAAASPLLSQAAASPTTGPVRQYNARKPGKKRLGTFLAVAFLTIVVISICMLGVFWTCLRRRKAMKRKGVQGDELKKFADSLQFELSEIRTATRNFATDNKLGEGGFGEVYKGKLDSGQEIAVKRLRKNSGQGIAEFETEIVLVAKLQHNNLVKLLGYCVAPKESLLVYEFLPNSSLDRFLSDPTKRSSLDWQRRFKIVIGIARGLMYLHEDSRIKIIHRDLKSSNILLDEAMNPKIADFGLARLFEVDQSQADTKRIVGTYGYMAPEYAITGQYSMKSDVYSFGVIVLEIVCGKINKLFGRLQLEEALLHRAWRVWNEGLVLDLVDTQLGNNFATEEVVKCIQIGLLCIQEDAADRPRMASIVAALSGQTVSLPSPKPPCFFGRPTGKEADALQEAHLCAALHVHSGAETITDVYSRD